jgi:hypothetical protein
MLAVIQQLDLFASDLGVEFKTSKDLGTQEPCQQLEFLGMMVDVSAGTVYAAPSQTKVAKVLAELSSI